MLNLFTDCTTNTDDCLLYVVLVIDNSATFRDKISIITNYVNKVVDSIQVSYTRLGILIFSQVDQRIVS